MAQDQNPQGGNFSIPPSHEREEIKTHSGLFQPFTDSYISTIIVRTASDYRYCLRCFIFGQITHVTIFHQKKQSFNCTTFRPLGLLQVHTTKLNLLNKCDILMKNRDMRYLSKDKTYLNRSSMSNNFYDHTDIVVHLIPDCCTM